MSSYITFKLPKRLTYDASNTSRNLITLYDAARQNKIAIEIVSSHNGYTVRTVPPKIRDANQGTVQSGVELSAINILYVDQFGTEIKLDSTDNIRAERAKFKDGGWEFEVKQFYSNQAGGAKTRKGTYEAMTVKELKERCIKRGYKHSGLRKHELIAVLRGQ